jgi:hypothetical protein
MVLICSMVDREGQKGGGVLEKLGNNLGSNISNRLGH